MPETFNTFGRTVLLVGALITSQSAFALIEETIQSLPVPGQAPVLPPRLPVRNPAFPGYLNGTDPREKIDYTNLGNNDTFSNREAS